MAELTTNPEDPRLTHGVDAEKVPQAPVYLVLSEAERATLVRNGEAVAA